MSKYESKYNDKMAQGAIALFKEGKFITQICAELGMTRASYYNWQTKYKDFKNACDWGLTLSEDYWIKFAIKHILYKDFKIKIWDRIMRTQFRESWSDNFDPIPRDSLKGFGGTLAKKAKVIDEALKNHLLGLRQYHVLMDALRLQGTVIEIDELAQKLEKIEKQVRGK
jgi:transposase